MPALPRNERGKVDRTALPSVEVRSTPPTLAGPAELWLSSIWESILGIDSIDREDDFFELGGDSLASTEVVAKIHDMFRIRITGGGVRGRQYRQRPCSAGGSVQNRSR